MTAPSYSRVLGANDRPNIGMIGLGGRGRALTGGAANLRTQASFIGEAG